MSILVFPKTKTKTKEKVNTTSQRSDRVKGNFQVKKKIEEGGKEQDNIPK